MKKRVLVLNCGSLASTDLNVALRDNEEFEVWGASTNKNHGVYVYKNYIDDIPNMNAPNFIEVLNKKIEEFNFKFIIAQHEDLILFLQQNKEKINACIVSSNSDTALLCRYKSKTYEKMKEYSFTPKTYQKEEVTEYPVFAKKDDDQGGRHAYKITNQQELELYASSDDMIICEYLPGEEVTIDCFSNKNRELLFCNPRAADRMLAGIDVHARKIELTDEIKYIAESLNKEIEFRGFWFFQIKKDANGKFKLLEIATRLPGAFSLSRCLDVNLPLLALKDFDGQDVKIIPNNTSIEADKQFFGKYSLGIEYNTVYIDFESCFKRMDSINPMLVMFLYQCVNKNIDLKILVKNKNELEEFCKNKRIEVNLFNEIIETDFENIKEILKQENSILLSNNETLKNKVKDNNNKYCCFSNNIIEALIDWRS